MLHLRGGSMLVRLTPDQIGDYWPMIEQSIVAALPPIVSEQAGAVKNILVSLLSGIMDCWVSFDTETKTILGTVTTVIASDPISGTRDLLIYTVHGFGSLQERHWQEGFVTIRKWARANNCSRITAYTDNPEIVTLSERFGGEVRQYIAIPILK